MLTTTFTVLVRQSPLALPVSILGDSYFQKASTPAFSRPSSSLPKRRDDYGKFHWQRLHLHECCNFSQGLIIFQRDDKVELSSLLTDEDGSMIYLGGGSRVTIDGTRSPTYRVLDRISSWKLPRQLSCSSNSRETYKM